MIAQPAQALDLREPPAPRERDSVRRGGLVFAPGQAVAPQLAANRRSIPAHQVADLTTRFSGCMQPENLNTIIKIELVISLAHRNSGLYRCCTSFVNLGPARNRPLIASVRLGVRNKVHRSQFSQSEYQSIRDKSQGMKLLAEEVRQEIDKRISI